ncbi:MAG: hypothetical protein GF393_00005 [Armatimonadia bacterium]|nr:hypothetical protein [Armatimonadia bacterium]
MSGQRRLEPLRRAPDKRRDSWDNVQAPHPGVRDPRSVRLGDWPPLVNAAIVVTLAFVTALAILAATVASPVGEVHQWVRWTSDTGDMSLEHPSGWAVRSLGGPDQTYLVVVRSQWVRIHVISESGLAGAAGLYRRLGNNPARYQALEALHASTGQTWERQLALSDLEEGRVGRTVIGGLPAVWSQFKYTGVAIEDGEAMTGYRATILGSSRGIIASAVAPSDNWEQFRPIALHVLRSIRFGDRAG